MLHFTQFTTSTYFTTNTTLYVGAYFNRVTTGTNGPLSPGFVPLILAFCPICPDQNLTAQAMMPKFSL